MSAAHATNLINPFNQVPLGQSQNAEHNPDEISREEFARDEIAQ